MVILYKNENMKKVFFAVATSKISRPVSLKWMYTVNCLVHCPQVMLHSQPLLSSEHVLVPSSQLRWVQPAQSADWRKRWLVCLYPQSQSSAPRGCSSCLFLTFLLSGKKKKSYKTFSWGTSQLWKITYSYTVQTVYTVYWLFHFFTMLNQMFLSYKIKMIVNSGWIRKYNVTSVPLPF